MSQDSVNLTNVDVSTPTLLDLDGALFPPHDDFSNDILINEKSDFAVLKERFCKFLCETCHYSLSSVNIRVADINRICSEVSSLLNPQVNDSKSMDMATVFNQRALEVVPLIEQKWKNVHSRLRYFTTLRMFAQANEMEESTIHLYDTYEQSYKARVTIANEKRRNEKAVLPLKAVKSLIDETYAQGTLGHVLLSIYVFWPLRDDLAKLLIVSSHELTLRFENKVVRGKTVPINNFLIVQEDGKMFLQINRSKTVPKCYDPLTEELPDWLVATIKKYMEAYNLKPILDYTERPQFLFGCMPLSHQVLYFGKRLGIRHFTINYMRNVHATEAREANDPFVEARTRRLMFHSATTSTKYQANIIN